MIPEIFLEVTDFTKGDGNNDDCCGGIEVKNV